MKYRPLTRFLEDRPTRGPWKATFKKIEKILGFPLPRSAYKHQAWWSNYERSQSTGWLDAGYKTADLDIENQSVTFVYHGAESASEAGQGGGHGDDTAVGELTIAQAKAGLARKFGVRESQVEIVIKA